MFGRDLAAAIEAQAVAAAGLPADGGETRPGRDLAIEPPGEALDDEIVAAVDVKTLVGATEEAPAAGAASRRRDR